MPNHYNTPTISEYAHQRVRSLNKKINLVGLLFSIVLTLSGSMIYHYAEFERGMKTVSEGLSPTIGLGGDFIPKHIMRGAISTGNFKGFWVYDNNQEIIAKRTLLPIDNPKISSNRFIVQSFHVITISSTPLIINGEKIGTMVAAYHIPIAPIILLMTFSILIIIFMTYFLKRSIDNFSTGLTSPITEMASAISKSTDQPLSQNWSLVEINHLYQTFKDYLRKSKEAEEAKRAFIVNKKVASIAYKVRHDIKASLYIAENKLNDIPSSLSSIKSTFKSILERISSTVEDIPKFEEKVDSCEEDELRSNHVASIVSEIVSEFSMSKIDNKDIKFNTKYQEESFHLFSLIDMVKFKRSFINLLKNAIDAIQDKGEVNISFSNDDNFLCLSIQDNGVGMTKEQLEQIGQAGVTFKGESGSGLGLSSAIKNIKRWGGKIEINSSFGKGTEVKITLPLEEENTLFPTKIFFEPNTEVAVADDDPVYLDLYRSKFSGHDFKNHNINFTYFNNTNRAKQWVEKLKEKGTNYLFLSDQNFGFDQDLGLQVVKELGVQEKSILITSDATKRDLIKKSEKEGVSLISKAILSDLEFCIIF